MIPRTLNLPTAILNSEELHAVYERFDDAFCAWANQNEVENPALDEVMHFLQEAWLQLEQIALDPAPLDGSAS
jgi:hypothetical protein